MENNAGLIIFCTFVVIVILALFFSALLTNKPDDPEPEPEKHYIYGPQIGETFTYMETEITVTNPFYMIGCTNSIHGTYKDDAGCIREIKIDFFAYEILVGEVEQKEQ